MADKRAGVFVCLLRTDPNLGEVEGLGRLQGNGTGPVFWFCWEISLLFILSSSCLEVPQEKKNHVLRGGSSSCYWKNWFLTLTELHINCNSGSSGSWRQRLYFLLPSLSTFSSGYTNRSPRLSCTPFPTAFLCCVPTRWSIPLLIGLWNLKHLTCFNFLFVNCCFYWLSLSYLLQDVLFTCQITMCCFILSQHTAFSVKDIQWGMAQFVQQWNA